MKKFERITEAQIRSKGVQSLADRPNASSQYGEGGLTAAQLKAAFDRLAIYLAEKINIIQSALSAEDAPEYIRIGGEDGAEVTLDDLLKSITNGNLASNIMLYSSATDSDLKSLQVIINLIAKGISNNASQIRIIEDNQEGFIDTSKLEEELKNFRIQIGRVFGIRLEISQESHLHPTYLGLYNEEDRLLSKVDISNLVGDASVIVDDYLSSLSERPVQNKVITERFNEIESMISGVEEDLRMLNEGGVK